MATYTREEFVRQVLVELTVLDANEAPEAEDAVLVGQKTDQKFEELYEEGLLPFDISGEIPGRYFLPLVAVVANECTGAFTPPHVAELEAKSVKGMKRLWKLRQRAYFGVPTEATYY